MEFDDFSPLQVSYILARVQPAEVSPGQSDGSAFIQKDPKKLMPPPTVSAGEIQGRGSEVQDRSRSITRKRSSTPPSQKTEEASSSRKASWEWQELFSDTAGYPDRRDYEDRSPSPEEGFSADLSGLPMPTKQARQFSNDFLPRDFDRTVRSWTPYRAEAIKRRKSARTSWPAKKRGVVPTQQRPKLTNIQAGEKASSVSSKHLQGPKSRTEDKSAENSVLNQATQRSLE